MLRSLLCKVQTVKVHKTDIYQGHPVIWYVTKCVVICWPSICLIKLYWGCKNIYLAEKSILLIIYQAGLGTECYF